MSRVDPVDLLQSWYLMESLPTVAYGLKRGQKILGQAAFWKLATFSYLAANSGCFTFKLFLNYTMEPITENPLKSPKNKLVPRIMQSLSEEFDFHQLLSFAVSHARAARSVKNSRFGSSFFTPGGRLVRKRDRKSVV